MSSLALTCKNVTQPVPKGYSLKDSLGPSLAMEKSLEKNRLVKQKLKVVLWQLNHVSG